MRALLDVNLLVALMDEDHIHHEQAHRWWASNSKAGWASCPLTENGFVRIMSRSTYAERPFSAEELIQCLGEFIRKTDHEFWADDLSLRDPEIFAPERIHGSRQITDIYLLALAAKHKARLATLDEGIAISAVRIATDKALCVIGGE